MEAEHLTLRSTCRKVAPHHIEQVTEEDVRRAAASFTPEQIRAGMVVMAQQYKFGEVAAHAKGSTLRAALKLVADADYTTGPTAQARGVVKQNRLLQCAVLENLDDELHKWCLNELQRVAGLNNNSSGTGAAAAAETKP